MLREEPKFNEDTPMMREHCRHVTGLESTFAKIEQLSGSIAKRNVRHPSPILISQGYFNNISAKEPRMNLFERNKFEMRAHRSFPNFYLKGRSSSRWNFQTIIWVISRTLQCDNCFAPRLFLYKFLRCKTDKNQVEAEPWKLNVNYLKATSHYAINYLDTLAGWHQFLLYRTIRHCTRENFNARYGDAFRFLQKTKTTPLSRTTRSRWISAANL